MLRSAIHMDGAIHLVVSPTNALARAETDLPALIRCDVMHVGPTAVIILGANSEHMDTRAMLEEAFSRLLPKQQAIAAKA